MTRWWLAALVTLMPCLCPADALSGSRPNILFIMTDDQGYPVLGRHGHPWIETPHLDALHDASTRFERYLVSPTCAPTRAALLSGRHPMRNGVTHTIHERERMALDTITLPTVLGEAGYRCGIFGKWHLGDEDPYQPHNRGFQEAFIHGCGGIGQKYSGSCADVPNNKYWDTVVRHNGSFVKTKGFCTDTFFTAAMGWMREQASSGKPFFAYLSTNAPHGPFLAPEEYKKRFLEMGFHPRQAGYYGMVENIDDNIGRVLTFLEEEGLADNTLLIFTSDNGTTYHGAGGAGKTIGTLPDGTPAVSYNAEMRGMKVSHYEGGVRVPLFLRWPGKLTADRSIDAVTAHIDIFPTLAELAGARIPQDQVEGRSMLPLLEDATAEWPHRMLVTHRGRWKPGESPEEYKYQFFSVRDHQFRWDGTALYKLEDDPGEQTDVAAAHPEVVSRMKAHYEQWWKDTRPLMVNEHVPHPTPRPYHAWYHEQLAGPGIPDWQPPKELPELKR